jgi:hypothetical protein
VNKVIANLQDEGSKEILYRWISRHLEIEAFSKHHGVLVGVISVTQCQPRLPPLATFFGALSLSIYDRFADCRNIYQKSELDRVVQVCQSLCFVKVSQVFLGLSLSYLA